jgi:LysR family transcriptional regulator of abg operon
MNLTHLRHLLAVADSGSFRAAAKKLNLSQSAITKSMKALETEFGVPLILRGSQNSSLTEFGLELLAHARSVCTEIDYATARIRRLASDAGTKISIGTIATASIQLLPDTVRRFQSKHPNVDVTVVTGFTGFLIPRMLEGTIDIVVGSQIAGALPAGVKFDRLFAASYCVVVRPGHRLEHVTSMEAFSDAEWMVPTELGKSTSPFFRVHRSLGLPEPKIRIQSDCPFFFQRMIASSDLVGMFRRYIKDQSVIPFSGKLIDFPDLAIADEVGVFTRAHHSSSVLVEELVESLKERAAVFRREKFLT